MGWYQDLPVRLLRINWYDMSNWVPWLMFAVGSKNARIHVDAFLNILGEDENSWGLSHKGLIWHGGKNKQYIKPFKENVPTKVGIFFDGNVGNPTFYKDNCCLGIAFSGLNKITEPLYPIE